MFETDDAGTTLQNALVHHRRRFDKTSHLAELSQSTLPPMLLLLLMAAGEPNSAEPLGHAIGCLGALQEHIAMGRNSSPETRKRGREAVGALFSAVATLRQDVC